MFITLVVHNAPEPLGGTYKFASAHLTLTGGGIELEELCARLEKLSGTSEKCAVKQVFDLTETPHLQAILEPSSISARAELDQLLTKLAAAAYGCGNVDGHNEVLNERR